jgi:NAD-dependent SIR2 family protein deacetylase
MFFKKVSSQMLFVVFVAGFSTVSGMEKEGRLQNLYEKIFNAMDSNDESSIEAIYDSEEMAFARENINTLNPLTYAV